MFIDKKTMLKIWFNHGLNSTIFWGTGHRRLSAQLGLVSLIGKQPFFTLYLELYSDKLLFPLTVATVFIRLYTMAHIKFLEFPIRRLFKGSVYFKITFFKSLTTVIVYHLWILYNLKVPMSPLFCWDRIINVWMVQITKLYWGFSYYPQVNAFFWLGAAFIRGRYLLVILLPSAAFDQGWGLFEGSVYLRVAFNRINMVLVCVSLIVTSKVF